MKQYNTPLIIKNNQAQSLEKVSLNSAGYSEEWIQDLCFNNPGLLPVDDLEPAFRGMIPICKELMTPSGAIDLVFVNENGFITIGECKLWRNPEARRKVIGQVLDYAKELCKWDFTHFQSQCLKARNDENSSLIDIMLNYFPEIDEVSFIDNINHNLKKGRFLIAIIGDGIRENMEELSEFLQRNDHLNFTLSLIEMPIYQTADQELVITPRILAKTREIERIVYRMAETTELRSSSTSEPAGESQTISDKVFFERLEQSIGQDKTNALKKFIDELSSELYIKPVTGRGKKLSLNLKSANDTYNFASIQEDGEVWFYGIITKTEEIGDKNIGMRYLQKLADAINGEFYDQYK